MVRDARRGALLPMTAALAAVAVLAVLPVVADMLDRHHVLIFSRIEHDDALRRAAGDADVLDRAADQLALVGHQHDLIAVLDGDRKSTRLNSSHLVISYAV